MVTLAFSLWLGSLQGNRVGISDVESKISAANMENEPAKKVGLLYEAQQMLEGLITGDLLVTGEDFRKASNLFRVDNRFFEGQRVRYELLLTAAKLGDVPAQKLVPKGWDELVISLGRNQRFGFENKPKISYPGLYRVISAPKGVTQFWLNFDSSLKKGVGAGESPEIKAIMDADQKARDRDWSKLKPKDFEEIAKGDANRLAQIKQIVAKGGVVSGSDYFNAALVCQHGQMFEDYALAHELSVCSMLLGYKGASWLAAASYDRMLLNMGHRQRFGTQSYMVAGKVFFSFLDETLMNETERFTVGRVKLAELRARQAKP